MHYIQPVMSAPCILKLILWFTPRMLKIPYVKRQLADDFENKISFVAYFWTICPFKNYLRTHTLTFILLHVYISRFTVLEDIITENKL